MVGAQQGSCVSELGVEAPLPPPPLRRLGIWGAVVPERRGASGQCPVEGAPQSPCCFQELFSLKRHKGKRCWSGFGRATPGKRRRSLREQFPAQTAGGARRLSCRRRGANSQAPSAKHGQHARGRGKGVGGTPRRLRLSESQLRGTSVRPRSALKKHPSGLSWFASVDRALACGPGFNSVKGTGGVFSSP